MKISINSAIYLLGNAILSSAQSINLGTAGAFGALGPAGVTNTGPTVVNGDVGTTGTSITGFPPGIVTGIIHIADGVAAQAQADSTAAFIQGGNLAPTVDEAGLGTIGGQTLVPGVYKFDTAVALDGILILDGAGVYVFQIASSFTTGGGSSVVLTNGATACNVYWIVGSAATLGTNSIFAGNILASTGITLTTGAQIAGGLYAGSAVTLDSNLVQACGASPAATGSSTSSIASSTTTSESTTSAIATPTLTPTTSVSPPAVPTSSVPNVPATTTSRPTTMTTTTTTTTKKSTTTTKKPTTTTYCPPTTTTTKKTTTTTKKSATTTKKTTTTSYCPPTTTTFKTTTKPTKTTTSTTKKITTTTKAGGYGGW